jgi:hypothetical protein
MKNEIKNFIYILMEVFLVIMDFAWWILAILAMDYRKGDEINFVLICGLFSIAVLLSYGFYFFIILELYRSHNYPGMDFPHGEISTYGDMVYLCKEFSAEDYFVNHLAKIFGLLVLGFSLSIFPLLGLFTLLHLSDLATLIILLGFVVLIIMWFVHLVKKNNWSRQNAFILHRGRLFYMCTGYTSTSPLDNLEKSAKIRSERRNVNVYSAYLNQLLGEYETHASVVEYHELVNPKIEKKNEDWVWISYGTEDENGKKPFIKVRNGYDWSLFDGVTETYVDVEPKGGYKRYF